MQLIHISDDPKLFVEVTPDLLIIHQQDALKEGHTHRVMLEAWEALEVARRLQEFAA